jgi:DNA-binding LacI/PurR family transcriptional regulator
MGSDDRAGTAHDDSAERPTMATVAEAAGVSPMTVSYTFNQPARVARATRQLVLETAHRLGYGGPNPTARALRRGRNDAIAVVLGEPLAYAFDDGQATRFLAGVADVCTERGLGIVLLPMQNDGHDRRRILDAAVDGYVIWTTSDEAPALEAVVASGLPHAIHGGPATSTGTLVTIDNQAAATAVGLEAVHDAKQPAVLSFPIEVERRPQVLRGPAIEEASFPVARHRLLGYRAACERAGLSWQDVVVATVPANTPTAAADAADDLLSGDFRPDAILAMSDTLAIEVVRAAAARSMSIPTDLRITGWDDTPEADTYGLTTVRQDLRMQGAACAHALLGDPPGVEVVTWSVIVRRTTRPRP